MSLRSVAKELGITPAYLSYMVNGKRPWREDLYERYCEVVNTSTEIKAESVNRIPPQIAISDTNPRTRSVRDLHGVQGVASSNLAAPTIPQIQTVACTLLCSSKEEGTCNSLRALPGLPAHPMQVRYRAALRPAPTLVE